MIFSTVAMLVIGLAPASDASIQTDWSGGPGLSGPLSMWTSRFSSSIGASWRSIPGQVALSSTPLVPSVKHPLAVGQTVAGGTCAADVDGDGDADVISAQYLSLQWWERLPDGTWASHPIIDDFWGMAAAYVAAADLDQDGDLDIIVTTSYGPPEDQTNGRITWFENLAGNGSAWAAHIVEQEFYGVNRIAIGDLDGDGDLDLVSDSYLAYSIPGTDDVIWLENTDGQGRTWVHHTIDTNYPNALSVSLADIDGDDDLDIFCTTAALPGPNPSNIVWYENTLNAAGTWPRHVLQSSFSYAVGATAIDMDGDGDSDVVAASYDFNQVAWFENINPLSTAWPKHLLSPGIAHPIDIRVGDIDGDGDLDVLGYTQFIGSDTIAWWQNTAGTGLTWAQKIVATGLGYPSAVLGDANNDGKLDVIATEQGTSAGLGKLWWWDVTQFIASGSLTGSILDGGTKKAHLWDAIDFDASTPPLTSLAVEVRASNDAGDLGPWAAVTVPGQSLASLIDPSARYLQYRFTLVAAGPSICPIVRSIEVSATAPPPPPCPADVDLSGEVNIDDLLAIINAWGPCPANAPCPADTNGSLAVDIDDLLAIINAWGACP